ncbi:hypothetical protein [Pseudoxanthomonas sp.]|uniref:hypothetical protein n=1 Tax=Pseudoxanthomonas sp. TaxID=1871049 RepID=UPI002FE1384D
MHVPGSPWPKEPRGILQVKAADAQHLFDADTLAHEPFDFLDGTPGVPAPSDPSRPRRT